MQDVLHDDISASFHRHEDKNWGLLRTRCRNEKKVADVLGGEGILHYLPLLTKIKVYAHGKHVNSVPMFPNYVFVCLSAEQRTFVKALNGVWGVTLLAPVEEERLIRDLQRVRLCELQSEHHELVVNPGLYPGAPVRITKGPFKGQEAIVVKRVDAYSVMINLDFMDQFIELRWNAEELQL